MKTGEVVLWECKETGVKARFRFDEDYGWTVSFPGGLKSFKMLKQSNVKLPWPEVPDEYKDHIQKMNEERQEFIKNATWVHEDIYDEEYNR